jgi:hypothetical protein
VKKPGQVCTAFSKVFACCGIKKRGLRPIWHSLLFRICVLIIEFTKLSANGCYSIFIVFKSSRANSETRSITMVKCRPKNGLVVSKSIFSSTYVVEKMLLPTEMYCMKMLFSLAACAPRILYFWKVSSESAPKLATRAVVSVVICWVPVVSSVFTSSGLVEGGCSYSSPSVATGGFWTAEKTSRSMKLTA